MKPWAARPLFFIASACALSLAAVGLRRTKLQLLQPIAGRIDRPLSLADELPAARTLAAAPVAARVRTVNAIASRRPGRARIAPPEQLGHLPKQRNETAPCLWMSISV